MSLTDLNLRQLDWDIEWQFKDKVRDIDTRCIQFTLTYKEHGEASEIRLTLDNSDKFFTKNTVFNAGMTIKLYLHYALQPKKLMGEFIIDEISDTDVPSSIEVCAISANCITASLKTKTTKGYENQSLKSIVADVGKRNNLKVDFQGKDILFKRKDQKECHDLKFLTDLAELYGFRVRIVEGVLHFVDRDTLHHDPAEKSLKGLISTRSFTYKAHKGAIASQVRYYDPEKNKLMEARIYKTITDNLRNSMQSGKIKKEEITPEIVNQIHIAEAKARTGDLTSLNNLTQELLDKFGDRLSLPASTQIKVTQKIDSLQEADTIAKAQLNQANDHQYECSFDAQGDPDFIPPFNINVEDEGQWDGKWHITEAEHTYSKSSGYRMTLKGYKL